MRRAYKKYIAVSVNWGSTIVGLAGGLGNNPPAILGSMLGPPSSLAKLPSQQEHKKLQEEAEDSTTEPFL